MAERRSPLDINGLTHSDGFVESLEQYTIISIKYPSCQILVSFSKWNIELEKAKEIYITSRSPSPSYEDSWPLEVSLP